MVRLEYRCGLISIAVAGMLWMSCARGTTDESIGEGGSSGASSPAAASGATGSTTGSGGAMSAASSSAAGTSVCMSSADCPAGNYCLAFVCTPCDSDQHCGASCTDCTATGDICDPNGNCIECMVDGDCSMGSYCDAGTCAPCDTAQKCGLTCAACSGTTPDCDGSACVCNATSCDPNQTCTAGMCEVCKTDMACGPTCSACGGTTPLCLDQGMTSQCVECLTAADCQPGLMCVGNICGDACTLSAKSFDFEADDQGFTHAPTSGGVALDDPWARGFPIGITCHGGMNCWATSLSVVGYTDCQTAELLSPVIDLSACAGTSKTLTLSFWHYYQFEPQSSNRWWDGGVLQLSTDSGTTWTDVTTSQPYEGLIDGSYVGCSPIPAIGGHQGWSGSIPGGMWVQVTVNLAAVYHVPGFRVRWLFGVDEALTDRGWFIDDVAVTVQ